MFSYLRNAINSLVCSEEDIMERQFKRLKNVAETTMLPKELFILISSYAVTIDASDDEKIEHKHLPDLISKLKKLQDILINKGNLEIRMQEQFTKEVIAIYKYRQSEIIEQRKKLALNSDGTPKIRGYSLLFPQYPQTMFV